MSQKDIHTLFIKVYIREQRIIFNTGYFVNIMPEHYSSLTSAVMFDSPDTENIKFI